jgi:phenylacetate-CoA ligase
MWSGGLTDHLSLESVGATVIPFGIGHTQRLMETIEELQITAISCTPSYPAVMEKVLRESTIRRDPRDLGLRLGLFGGEACLDNVSFRDALETTWGFKVRNANYGLSEVLSLFAGQCEASHDLHFHGEDVIFAELIDPNTLRQIPIETGATGELVCTNLNRECQPLVRYRTGDLITISSVDRCECGRTSWRFRVSGRSDDMFNVRGVNVFPSAIQRVLLSRPQQTSGHFRIHLRGPGPYDRIALKVEQAEHGDPSQVCQASSELEVAIRNAIGASAIVTMVPFESLPRSEGKTSWIERTPE